MVIQYHQVVLVSLSNPRNPVVLSVSILPLIVLLARFSNLHPSRIGTSLQSALFSSWRTAVLAGTCAFVAVLFVMSALYLVPAGPRNEGIVLFDEAHGDWESTRIAMDTETYGLATTYNYASLYDWLSYYYPVGQLTQSVDEQSLSSQKNHLGNSSHPSNRKCFCLLIR